MLPSCISIYANPIAILKRQDAQRDNIFIWIQMAPRPVSLCYAFASRTVSVPFRAVRILAGSRMLFVVTAASTISFVEKLRNRFTFNRNALKGSSCRGNNVHILVFSWEHRGGSLVTRESRNSLRSLVIRDRSVALEGEYFSIVRFK